MLTTQKNSLGIQDPITHTYLLHKKGVPSNSHSHTGPDFTPPPAYPWKFLSRGGGRLKGGDKNPAARGLKKNHTGQIKGRKKHQLWIRFLPVPEKAAEDPTKKIDTKHQFLKHYMVVRSWLVDVLFATSEKKRGSDSRPVWPRSKSCLAGRLSDPRLVFSNSCPEEEVEEK